ncbi:hypothetical protein SSAG_01550 [Streptomyces sp. Mg1]|nr:hypothetical protein SSAG_01550 [Streptomyces sp. Mg1]
MTPRALGPDVPAQVSRSRDRPLQLTATGPAMTEVFSTTAPDGTTFTITKRSR